MARRLIFLALVAALATAGPTSFADLGRVVAQNQRSLAPFVPTPQDVVDRMLELADVTSDDVVYDLGCGMVGSSSPPPNGSARVVSVSTSIPNASQTRTPTPHGRASSISSNSSNRARSPSTYLKPPSSPFTYYRRRT